MNRVVFISSTYEDLKDYRSKAREALRPFRADIRGMEEFGARGTPSLETCLQEVEQCDIFIGLIGFRLGSVDPASGKSYTRREYERAYELKKDVRIYLMDDSIALVPPKFVDRDRKHIKLEDFKRVLRNRHTVCTFGSPDDLAARLGKDLRTVLEAREPEEPHDSGSPLPFSVKIHSPQIQSGSRGSIEVRPRRETWTPFFFAIPAGEKESVRPTILRGPRGRPPQAGVLCMSRKGTSPDGAWWIMSAQDEATPTQSYFIDYDVLPSKVAFGVEGRQPQYRMDPLVEC